MSELADATGPVGRPGWLRRNGVLLAGVVLVVAGSIAVVLGSGMASVSVGWFAYAPLAETILVATPPLWQEPFFVGLVIAVIGLMLVAGDLGYRAGRKRGVAS